MAQSDRDEQRRKFAITARVDWLAPGHRGWH